MRKSHTTITRHQEDKIQSNQLSLPYHDDFQSRIDIKQRTAKHILNEESHDGSNNQQRITNNRTTAIEWTAA